MRFEGIKLFAQRRCRCFTGCDPSQCLSTLVLSNARRMAERFDLCFKLCVQSELAGEIADDAAAFLNLLASNSYAFFPLGNLS